MNTTSPLLHANLLTSRRSALEDRARRLVLARLAGISRGALTLHEGPCSLAFGEQDATPEIDASLHVHDDAFYAAVAFGGSIGAAESYARGEWTAHDLTAVVRLLIRNREVLDGMESGIAGLAAPLRRALHWLNRNTRTGSRRNIEAHYDLGNEFFALFLDESMTYSSAIFESDATDLHAAQIAKLERVCRKLQLRPDDHLLEIGGGWGALAVHAARTYGCRVTTTTISPAQFAFARERIAAAGLTDRIELLLADYRDLKGQYDKVASIEMIEAVGHQYYETYFRRAGALLRPHGLMLIQAITIADQRYESARRSVDFIQRYIFPGSTIPSVAALSRAITRASDLRLVNLEDFGPHYARTLRLWRERLLAHGDSVRALGYGDAFRRLWDFYFCYCEGGFEERALGDVHLLLAMPGNRRAPILTPLAAI